MHFKLRFLIPLFCLIFLGCSFLPNELKTAEQLMETAPDSALHVLQRMHTENIMMSSSDKALYGLLLFQALDKNKMPLQPDSAITYSLKYFQRTNDKTRLAYCYYFKAKLYKNAQQYDDATVLYLRALDNSQDKKDYELLGKIYKDMGDICFLQYDYKESREKYTLAVENFKKAGKLIDASYRMLDIGKSYYAIKDYKQAQNYFHKALVQNKDSVFYGSALQEIGASYFYSKQFDSSELYLRKSLKYPYLKFDYSARCYVLGNLYFSKGEYDSAYHYATVALKYPANFFTQRECYRILANTEYLKGNFKQMAVYMTSFQAYSDSVRKVESQTKTSVLEDVHNTTQVAGKTKSYLIVLAWVIPIIILISLYVVYILRKRTKGKEKELEEAEVQISQKQDLLVDSLLQKIEETRVAQSAVYKKASMTERERMDKEMYNSCLHVNDWEAFKKLMNKTFNNIIDNLERDTPEITHKELTWCCLFLLDIPTPDIALILDSQPGSLYKLKQRLTQKMNLKSTKDLDLFLTEKSEGK